MDIRTLISRRRAPVMGVAALLIVLYHARWQAAPFPLGLVSREGQLGVDLFVYLSGFGLAHSLWRNPAPGDYWARRLRRLLPAYYVWLAAMSAAALGMALFMGWRGDFGHWLLLHALPVGVWINHQPQVWYVSAALGYCALAPVFFALLSRARRPRVAAALLMLVTGVLLPAVSGLKDVEIATARIPVLIAGLTTGLLHAEGRPARRTDALWLAGMAALGLCLGFGGNLPLLAELKPSRLHRLTLGLLAPGLTALLAGGFEGLSRTRARWLERPFAALGAVSLESYLAHVAVCALVRDALKLPPPLVLAILLACCYPLARGTAWAAGRLLALRDARFAARGAAGAAGNDAAPRA